MLAMCNVAPTMEEADADLKAMAAAKGWGDDVVEMVKSILIHGDADTAGERLESMVAAGLDGLTVNAPGNGHIPGRVSLLGEVAQKALG